jgi:two-component system response regulator FixJ
MPEIVVHVIDDDDGLRESLAYLLEANGVTTRLYDSAIGFLDGLGEVGPGCILTDVRMPQMNGLELVRELRRRECDMPVVVMTGHADVGLAVEAMKTGVVDFIEKPFAEEVLLRAVKEALASPRYRPMDVGSAQQRLAGLSGREREVLAGVVAGKANKVIAHDLQISQRTVEIYRANLMMKTNVRSLSELMRIALAAGL